MACSIDATVGGASANAYCDVTYADSYHETHPYSSTWDAATADSKCRALQTATRLLDSWYEWNGEVVSSDQALLWPRANVIGPNGYLEATDAIPVRIKQATAELGRQLLAADRTADSDIDAQGITGLTAGPISLTFRPKAVKTIPDAVQALVGWYGSLRGRSSGPVTLYRS